jgi:hypothetical protein
MRAVIRSTVLRNLSATFRVVFTLVCTNVIAAACWADDVPLLPIAPSPSTAAAKGLTRRFLSQSGLSESQSAAQPRTGFDSSAVKKPASPEQHHFWDRNNLLLFSAVGGARALDYSSTLNMRRRGRQEILLTNDVVDNHPAFAAIEVGGTAVSVGASYLFHRYHHHRLERWTSIIHASLTTSGAIRNYCLQTAHPSTTP